MINLSDRQKLHEFIVLDFTIRTLQHDYPNLEKLKTKAIHVPIQDAMLKHIRQEYFHLKRYFQKKRISIIGWHRVDQYFSDIHVATAGENQVLRYANQALKAEIETALMKQMKLFQK